MVRKVELDSNFPIIQTVPQIASDAGGKCFHMSATWHRPIGDRVPDRSQTVTDHMETRFYCAPIAETLFEGLSIWLRNKQVMLGTPKIMCVNDIMYAGEFFRRRYLGTRLVTD